MQDELEKIELQAYVNGLYNKASILSAMNKDNKYPEKPLGLFNEKEEEVELTEEQKVAEAKKVFEMLSIMQFNHENTKGSKG